MAPASDLPINRFAHQIVEAVDANPVVVVVGETGSGKTTQLSQILHEAGYTKSGCIAVTQPRRVAAVSVSRRVASEMGVQVGEEVGYSIRFEDRTSSRTLIKYLTDGCLLRECLIDPDLRRYSVVVLDEAHERTLNTDVLLGLLKQIIFNKGDLGLKIVITSATLDGEKISKYFNGCPVLNIPGKMYPVKILYSTEQPLNYLESAVQTALDIHVREPEGDVLVFLTGQEEIEKAVRKLEDGIRTLEEGSCMDAIILPLYASLPPELQARVFVKGPSNCRRIIVATNVAETSLTVDGVVYVIDPGFVKQKQYNPTTGMDALVVVQISKVQAIQRAGRAGRTRPGKCYRLYPASVFETEFLNVTVPEIQRSSLTGAVLYLKSLELPNLDVLRFDFLDQPTLESLQDALRQLYIIDAIDSSGKVAALGKSMAELPLEPSLARALLAADEMGCLDQALVVAGMLSCESVFFQPHSKVKKDERPKPNLPDGNGLGDHIQLLQIYEEWKHRDFDLDWCKDHFLQVRSMKLAKDVTHQLSLIMQTNHSQQSYKRRPSQNTGKFTRIRKALCKGFANSIAHRMAKHNGYKVISHSSQLVQVHPSCCSLKVDDDGLLPEWILYHELVITARPYVRKVCTVEGSWVEPILIKLQNLDVHGLGGQGVVHTRSLVPTSLVPLAECNQESRKENEDARGDAVKAARERFLARKKLRTVK